MNQGTDGETSYLYALIREEEQASEKGGRTGAQRGEERRGRGRTSGARRGNGGRQAVSEKQKGGPGSGCKPGSPYEL